VIRYTPTSDLQAIKRCRRDNRLASCENRSIDMPKMKTKSGAAKRFKAQGSGGIKRTKAFLRHILTKKSTKRKRNMRGMTQVDATNIKSVRAMLPYA